MLPLSAVADNKSKAATQEECVELAKIIYGGSYWNTSTPRKALLLRTYIMF